MSKTNTATLEAIEIFEKEETFSSIPGSPQDDKKYFLKTMSLRIRLGGVIPWVEESIIRPVVPFCGTAEDFPSFVVKKI